MIWQIKPRHFYFAFSKFKKRSDSWTVELINFKIFPIHVIMCARISWELKLRTVLLIQISFQNILNSWAGLMQPFFFLILFKFWLELISAESYEYKYIEGFLLTTMFISKGISFECYEKWSNWRFKSLFEMLNKEKFYTLTVQQKIDTSSKR